MDININELDLIIKSSNTMFLCGNGFSMNFDSCFSNIMDRLYESHKILIRKSQYRIKANDKFKNKCSDNFKGTLSYTRNMTKKQIYKLFEDGIEFAKTIISDKKLKTVLQENKVTTELTFGYNEFTILEKLIENWNSGGLKKVNIEYIAILVYFYFAVGEIKIREYDMFYNTFVKAIRLGDINKASFIKEENKENKEGRLIESILYNGFTTYYRFLFSIAIFNEGKAVNLNEMEFLYMLNIEKLREFLRGFESVCTLNYDTLLENILPNTEVHHLHGVFNMIDEEEFCNGQSLRLMFDNDKKVSFSDILIGDYIYNKNKRNIINNLSVSNNHNNKRTEAPLKILERDIQGKKIETIFIFGLNINNDQHIIRALIINLCLVGIKKPQIIYSYFTENDKKEFDKTFHSLITFSEELNEYAKNIDIRYVKTQDIIEKYFK